MITEPITRVMLIDDHKMLRDGLCALLDEESHIQVAAQASTAREAFLQIGQIEPDIVILDLGLPDMNGIEVIPILKDLHPPVKIIVLSMYISREHVARAVEAGCDGYVPKSSTHTSLLEALRIVASGESYLHPKAASSLMESISHPESAHSLLEELSERELEVVRLTAMGFTSRESGLKLNISPKTVDTYRMRAMEKLDLKQRSELIRFALQAGLLNELIDNDINPA